MIMTKSTVKKSETKVIATNEQSAQFDSRSLPTLLQWIKKQPRDRDTNALFMVRVVFFDGGYGNHTLCTEQFRARLGSNAITYESLSDAISTVERDNDQLYVRVTGQTAGNFEIVQANNPAYTRTRLRWFGGSDPYIGVELEYDEATQG